MQQWVIGAGGLLGGSIQKQIEHPFQAADIPWNDATAALRVLLENLTRFSQQVAASQTSDWRIYWAAGAAVVSSQPQQIASEIDLFRKFVDSVADWLPEQTGRFFLASSAGGIFAGARDAPFRDSTSASPLGAYGRGKLAMELAAEETLAGFAPLIVGRIANLYGPGQDVTKQQGLVFSLCRAAAHRQPLSIYVPMETLRDYIYVDDAAAQIDCLVEACTGSIQRVNIASGNAVSIASLIGTVERVTRRRIPICAGIHPSAREQVLDLRIGPTTLPSSCNYAPTDLATGIKRTFNAVVRQPTSARG